MKLWRFYFRAVLRNPLYVLVLLGAASASLLMPRMAFMPAAEAKGTLAIAFLVGAYYLAFLLDPRKLLTIPPFLLGLPALRERLALVLWVALSLPLLMLLWPLYGPSVFLGAHALSLLELSLLTTGSVLAWTFLPLPLMVVFAAPCAAERWALLLLLGMPYVVFVGLWLGRWLPSWHWRGLRYMPRYVGPVAVFLAGFDLYRRSAHTAMRFVFGDFVGLQAPDFDHLLLVFFFLLGGVLFLLLPFLNVFALREADATLADQRRITGTPWRRRVSALGFAFLVNLPLGLLMGWLGFVVISPGMLWHVVLSAAVFNVLFPTSYEQSDWTAYGLLGYLLWVHLLSQSPLWWLWDLVIGGIALLAYDIDLWLPGALARFHRQIFGIQQKSSGKSEV